MVIKTLRFKGYHVLETDNATQAIELARAHRPDLVISDINLGEADGYSILASLRAEPATATTPFILMTGNSNRDGMRHGMELGADDYLPKPFAPETLFAAVEARLRKQQAWQQPEQEQRSRLAKIAAAVPGIIFSFRLRPDGSTCVPYASPTMEDFYGVPVKDIVEDATPVFAKIHADDQARVRASIAESARTLSPWRDQFRILHPRKGCFWIEGQSTPERETDGGTLWHGFMSDVTERKRVEESLSASEQMLRLVLDTIPVRVFWKNRDSVYLGCNQLFANDAGMRSPAELVGKVDSELVWCDQAERYRGDDQHFMEQGETRCHYEEPQTTPAGQTITLRTSKIPLRDRQGSIMGILGVYEDITERKQAEEALRLREAALRAAANIVVMTDRAGRIVWTNPAFTRETGYTAEEVVGQNPRILRGCEYPPAFYKELWKTITSGQVWQGEFHNRRRDGTLMIEDATITPLLDEAGKITHYIAVKQNITERKRAEEALRAREEEFRAMFELASIGMAQADPHTGRLLRVNRKFCAITGYSAEELLRLRFPEITHPDDRAKDWESFLQVMQGRTPEYRAEKRYMRQDGAIAWVNVNVTVIRDPAGQPVHSLAAIEDISERKLAERAVREKLELRERLAKITAAMPGIIYAFRLRADGSACIPYASPTFQDFYGVRTEEVLEDASPVFNLIHPEDQADVAASITASARAMSPWRHEFRINHPKKGCFWIEGQSIPEREPDGSILWYGLMSDVTVRKEAQAAERRKQESKIRHQTALLKLTVQPKTKFAEALKEILRTDAQTLGVGRVSYWRLSPDASAITCEALFVVQEDRWLGGIELRRVDYPRYFETLASNPFIAATDAQTDPRTAEFAEAYLRPLGIVSMLDVPVWLQGKLVGVVCHEHLAECRQWSDEDQDFALSIGHMVSLALGERELGLREQRLNLFFSNATAGLCIFNRNLEFIQVNETLARINGPSRQDHLGKNLHEVIPGLAGALAPVFQTILTTGQPVLNLELSGETPASPGVVRSWTASYFPLSSEQGIPVEIGAVVVEITERKRAEEMLRESERFLQSTLDALSKHIAILNSDGEIIAANAVWKAFALANAGTLEACGVGSNYLAVCAAARGDSAQGAADVAEGIRAVLAGHRIRFELEYPCHSPTEERWFSMRVTRFSGDGPVRVVVAHENISERVRAEQERKNIEVQLRHAQKLESIGQLAAGIAHEINTPTQYIGDNTKFVRDSIAQLLPVLSAPKELLAAVRENRVTPELLEATEAALTAADLDYLSAELPKAIEDSLQGVERVAKIVRAMKEFSHPGTTEKTQVDLNHTIESTLTVARNEWKYVAEMVTEFDATLPPVLCQPGEFNQVILNLVVNAAHAIGDTPKGRDGAKGTITVSTKRDGDWVEVRIRDTGTGIPEAARGKVFDPFFTTKAVGKGTGQGLAIARSVIVDKHAGTISFETEMGQGTVFIIRLPLTPKQPAKGSGA